MAPSESISAIECDEYATAEPGSGEFALQGNVLADGVGVGGIRIDVSSSTSSTVACTRADGRWRVVVERNASYILEIDRETLPSGWELSSNSETRVPVEASERMTSLTRNYTLVEAGSEVSQLTTFRDVALDGHIYETGLGAELVVVPDDNVRSPTAKLYSLAAPEPISIVLDLEANEELESAMWLAEQSPESTPKAVALLYISTEASGLNATKDRVQMRVFDNDGVEIARHDLGNQIIGIPYNASSAPVARPAEYAALVGGTIVASTMREGNQYVLVGLDVDDAEELWRKTSDIEPESVGAALPNGLVAVDWDDSLLGIDPATGDVAWSAPRQRSVDAQGAARFITSYESASAWTGPDPVEAFDVETGKYLDLPDGFQSYAVDQRTGDSAFAWFLSADGGPGDGFMIRRADGSSGIRLSQGEIRDLDLAGVRGAWNGFVWVETSAGLDVVDIVTGDRADGMAGRVIGVPVYARDGWTITEVSGGTFGNDVATLSRHPNVDISVVDLPIFAATDD
ncbi:MAG TPA: hypothetical protein DHW40_04920 [Microbacterium sp.]|nr:hypothetical protein [Microbacterium sp.]